MLKSNTAYIMRPEAATSNVSRAVWPIEERRRLVMARSRQRQQLIAVRVQRRTPVHSGAHVHFFYLYVAGALFASMLTTWMFLWHQWLFVMLVVIAYVGLMMLLLHSLMNNVRDQDDARRGAASSSVAPVTPLPSSITRAAALRVYAMQRRAPETPLPQAPLIRVLETVSLREEEIHA